MLFQLAGVLGSIGISVYQAYAEKERARKADRAAKQAEQRRVDAETRAAAAARPTAPAQATRLSDYGITRTIPGAGIIPTQRVPSALVPMPAPGVFGRGGLQVPAAPAAGVGIIGPWSPEVLRGDIWSLDFYKQARREVLAINPQTGQLMQTKDLLERGIVPKKPFYRISPKGMLQIIRPRRMNPLNIRALNRSGRRIRAFQSVVGRYFTLGRPKVSMPKARKRRKAR